MPRGCPREFSCLAGIPEEDYRVTAKSPGRANCDVGYTGVLCATCVEGYHAADAFSNCTACDPESNPEYALFGLAAAAAALALAQVYGCWSQVQAMRAKQRQVLAKMGLVSNKKPKQPGAVSRLIKRGVAKWKAMLS